VSGPPPPAGDPTVRAIIYDAAGNIVLYFIGPSSVVDLNVPTGGHWTASTDIPLFPPPPAFP
jgi:hypothetical protein